MLHRQLLHVDVFCDDYDGQVEQRRDVSDDDASANAVSSRLSGTDLHAPALDLDFPASLVPSSTPGHFHLYLDRPMTWRRYRRLLRALMRAGIIDLGYYRASVKRRATHLRLPGVIK